MKHLFFMIFLLCAVSVNAQNTIKIDTLSLRYDLELKTLEQLQTWEVEVNAQNQYDLELKTLEQLQTCAVAVNTQNTIKIDTLSVQYYDLELKTQDQLQTLEIYQITNNTYEDYYTWITEKPIGNQTETEVIASFFLRRDCDLCPFLYYLYELGSTCVRQPPIPGLTFYKKIKKGQTFSYIITMENNHLNTYKDRIVIMKAEDLHGSHHLIPDEELMEDYSYELPYIVLHGE